MGVCACKPPKAIRRHNPLFVKGAGTVTAPRPVFGLGYEAAFHQVAVDVLEIVDEFFVVTNVAVVITPLPEPPLISDLAFGPGPPV